jgi:hypothetical protein
LQEVVVDDVNRDQRKGSRRKDRLSRAGPGQPAEPDAPPDGTTEGRTDPSATVTRTAAP